MTIEFNDYGICLDSNLTYIALSWQILITATILFVGYKFYKKRFGKIQLDRRVALTAPAVGRVAPKILWGRFAPYVRFM